MALARSTSGSPLSKNRLENGADSREEDKGCFGRRAVMMSTCSSDLSIEDGRAENVLIVLSITRVRESVVIASTEWAIATKNWKRREGVGWGELIVEFEEEGKSVAL